MPRVAGNYKKKCQGSNNSGNDKRTKAPATIIPVLKQLGVIEKTLFQREWEKSYTIEEAIAMSHKHIDDLWARKKNTYSSTN